MLPKREMSYKEFTEFFVELINLKDVKDFRKDDYIKYLHLFDGFEHQCIKWTIEKYEELMKRRRPCHKVDYYAYFMWYVYHFCSNLSIDTKIIDDFKSNNHYYRDKLFQEFEIEISDYVYDSDRDKIIEDKLDECNAIKFASVIVFLIKKTLADKKEFKCKFETSMNIEGTDNGYNDVFKVVEEYNHKVEELLNQYHTNITNLMKEYNSKIKELSKK